MKKFFNKLSFITLIFFSFSLLNVFANQKEYWAYTKSTSEGSAFFVDDDGEKTVYCYNHDYNQPGSSIIDSSNKTYYTRTESYLNTNDELMDVYGKEKKERIAAALAYGYPVNSSDLISKCGINEDEARYITQQLIWDICSGNDGPYGYEYGKFGYYDKLLELSKIKKFEQGNLNLIGDFKFTERGGQYSTDNLSTTGSVGSFMITNLPDDMVVKDWNTGQILNDKPIKVGQEFYIESSIKPNPDLKLKINYNYQEVKFYFYKYSRGGIKGKPDKPFQSLIRAELEDKTNEKSYEISIDGNFVPNQNIGKVVLTKKDFQNGSELQGAIFNLQDQKGNNIRTDLTTDENGQISLNDLAPGDYQFVETKAPDGYELDATPVKFTIVVGQKEAIKIEKVNDPNQVELKISKVDKENAKPLEGAEFEIFSINDIKNPLKFSFSNLYQKYEFNKQGDSTLKANNSDSSFTINKLGYGDYILKEIKAPNGYKLGKDIYIHLDSNNSYYKVGEDGKNINLDKNESLNLYQINVENEKGIVLPETGGNGFRIQSDIAILVIGINFILMITLLINKKRRFN